MNLRRQRINSGSGARMGYRTRSHARHRSAPSRSLLLQACHCPAWPLILSFEVPPRAHCSSSRDCHNAPLRASRATVSFASCKDALPGATFARGMSARKRLPRPGPQPTCAEISWMFWDIRARHTPCAAPPERISNPRPARVAISQHQEPMSHTHQRRKSTKVERCTGNETLCRA